MQIFRGDNIVFAISTPHKAATRSSDEAARFPLDLEPWSVDTDAISMSAIDEPRSRNNLREESIPARN